MLKVKLGIGHRWAIIQKRPHVGKAFERRWESMAEGQMLDGITQFKWTELGKPRVGDGGEAVVWCCPAGLQRAIHELNGIWIRELQLVIVHACFLDLRASSLSQAAPVPSGSTSVTQMQLWYRRKRCLRTVYTTSLGELNCQWKAVVLSPPLRAVGQGWTQVTQTFLFSLETKLQEGWELPEEREMQRW